MRCGAQDLPRLKGYDAPVVIDDHVERTNMHAENKPEYESESYVYQVQLWEHSSAVAVERDYFKG